MIDDGRRFLHRTSEKYDVIAIDAPPPLEAAGSSLLYSSQFYDLVKTHLVKGGILQQWFPGGESQILHSVARSLAASFPYVKVYPSIEDWGYHFLASMTPIPARTEADMVARLPAAARVDALEWFPQKTIHQVFTTMLSKEVPLETVLGDSEGPLLSDDQPFNEYYFLRRQLEKARRRILSET